MTSVQTVLLFKVNAHWSNLSTSGGSPVVQAWKNLSKSAKFLVMTLAGLRRFSYKIRSVGMKTIEYKRCWAFEMTSSAHLKFLKVSLQGYKNNHDQNHMVRWFLSVIASYCCCCLFVFSSYVLPVMNRGKKNSHPAQISNFLSSCFQ